MQTHESLNETAIRELIDTSVDGENTMQTFIDRYIEQGRQQGLFAGKREGRQEGRADVLLRLMGRKFGRLSNEQQRRIERADEESLLRWAEQVLFAETPEDVLR